MKSIHGTKETLVYAEHYITKRVYLCDYASDLKPGYNLHATSTPSEMDRVYRRISEQEHEQNEACIERIYNRGRENFERMRSVLQSRLHSSDCSNGERSLIRDGLRLLDEKDAKMQQNHVHGISAMQEEEAPLEGPRTRITFDA